MTPSIYISITEGNRKLVIDGPLDLLRSFLTTYTEKDQGDPAPAILPNADHPLAATARPSRQTAL